MRVPREAMGELANKVTVARYYPTGLSEIDAGRASTLAAEIETSVNSRVPAYARWKRMVDPRRLLKPSARIAVTSPLPGTTRPQVNGDRSRQPVS
jgi:hypothetical protein